MSTHATIVIRDHEREFLLYRHADGAPAECGADLAQVVARAGQGTRTPSACGVANDLLRRFYPATGAEPVRPVYELTDGRDSVEQLYVIDLAAAMIGHAERPPWHADRRDEDWTAHVQRYTLAEFVEFVNRDRAAVNERIAELKRREPRNQRIQQMQPLPLVRV